MSEDNKTSPPVVTDNEKSPEEKASFLSVITYSWLFGLLMKGYKKPLEMDDLYPLGSNLRADTVYSKFTENWNKLLAENKKASVAKALFNTFGSQFIWSGVNRFLGDMLIVCAPVVMLEIINFITASYYEPNAASKPPAWLGYVFAVTLLIMQLLQTLFINLSFSQSMRVGFLIRIALVNAVFQKSLSLSGLSRQLFSAGKIVNIMSTDISRLDFSMQFVHFAWSAPLQMIVASGLLIWQLGVSALVGIAVVVSSIPFQMWTGKQLLNKRASISSESDKRVKITQEVLQGIKVIKFNAWEESFIDLITKIRNEELSSVRGVLMLRAIVSGFLQTVPILACIVTLIVFVNTGGVLDTGRAFSSLALFYVLRIPLLVYPTVISQLADVGIALGRIQDILLSPELDTAPKRILDKNDDIAIKVENADFEWEKLEAEVAEKEEKTKLENGAFQGMKNINLSVMKGKLVAIVGKVGAGKSSFLNAFIGEMKRTSGSVTLNGTVAYCSQNSWIQNMTLKDNILFGKPYDANRYAETIRVCALESDLQVLAGGDNTEIGEKGVNLSGGQKARVNLARAVYAETDIYLLDDPMSAVDAHVGSHLFDECIRGALKDKTVILATHRIHILPEADYIIVLENGNIAEQGTYKELTEGKPDSLLNVLMKDVEMADEEDTEPTSVAPVQQKKADTPNQVVEANIIKKEGLERGQVSTKVYFEFAKLSGGAFISFWCAFLLVLAQCARIACDYWINIWVAQSVPGWSQAAYQITYVCLGLAQAFLMVISGVVFAFASYRASKKIHGAALESVLACPMSWFDSQPLGRIVNRFSRDVDTVDSLLSDSVRVFGFTLSMTASIIILICVLFQYFIIPVVPLLIIYYLTQAFYRRTSVELKRLDNVSRSPLYAHFSETLFGSGLATIRAYGVQEEFKEKTKILLDNNDKAYYLSVQTQRWLALRLESIAGFLVFFAALFGVATQGTSISPGLAGLAITYALQVTFVFNWAVKQATEIEMYMSSVERLLDYIHDLPNEEDPKSPTDKNYSENMELTKVSVMPPDGWVSKGAISFKDVVLKYRDDLPDVLKGVSFDVLPGEKVGIVGRTAAGKSSLIYCLFMLAEPRNGTVFIDGVDIKTLKKSELRKQISIIPQDSVIFSGTLRDNIDFFHEHTDEEIQKCLEQSGLVSAIDPKYGLNMPVSEGGENWSVGQKQLICLARAMLRGSKILVLDEATASIDLATDAFIQSSLRQHFQGCTILTIAHRLNTIIDYDKIIVMSYGKVVEMGPPNELVASKGVFYNMAVEQGVIKR